MKPRSLTLFIVGSIALALGVMCVTVAVLTLMGPSIGPVGKTCTLMACSNGFTVLFTGEVPSDYTAEVNGSDGSYFSATCHVEKGSATGNGCYPGGGLSVEGVFADEVTITVTWEGGSKTTKFQQTYQHVEPNGPGCGGDCMRGKDLTMSLP